MSSFSPRNRFLYSRHLDRALEFDKLAFYIHQKELWDSRHPLIPHNWLIEPHNGKIFNQTVLSTIESHVKSYHQPHNLTYAPSLTGLLDIVKGSMDLQCKAVANNMMKLDPSIIGNKLSKLAESLVIRSRYKMKQHILKIHHEIKLLSIANVYPVKIPSIPSISLYMDMIIVEDLFPKPVVLPFDFLLAVLDKLESTFLVSVYTELISFSPQYERINYTSMYDELYTLLNRAYSTLGNSAINLFKLLEPMCIGVVLKRQDQVTNDHNFLDTVVQDSISEFYYLKPWIDKILLIFERALDQFGDDVVPLILEMYGQEKMHYYPIVNQEAGMAKMHHYGTSIRTVDNIIVTNLIGQFMKEWLLAKFKKDNAVPEVILPSSIDNRIRAMIDQNRMESFEYCNRLPLNEWAKIIPKKNEDFDYYASDLDLLDDKGISPPRKHMYSLYAIDALKAHKKPLSRIRVNTRLVVEMLNRESIDIKSYFDRVESSGSIPYDWTLIQLKAKEKELKIIPRLFSILTFECRMMASVLERNIARSIMSLFNTHSMNMSGSQVRSRIEDLANLQSNPDYVWIYFHWDLSQWNFTFRGELMAPFLFYMNRIFGVEHYRLTLKLFTQALFVSANNYIVPEIKGRLTSWDAHSGGNQGICQKFWTLITIMILRMIVSEEHLEHQMIGAGDNQVVAARFPRGPDLKDKVSGFKERVVTIFNSVGLKMKQHESWDSDVLLEYQRRFHYKGVPVPNGLKLVNRATAGASEVTYGVGSYISTAMNAGVNIANMIADPYIGPLIAYIESYCILCLDPALEIRKNLSRGSLESLALVGADLGFLPFIQLTGFMYAGHKDTLTESLAGLKNIWDNYPEDHHKIDWLINYTPHQVNDDTLLQMIIDPHSINVKRPATPEAFIKTKIEEYLTNPLNVKNTKLQTLFRLMKHSPTVSLAHELLKIKPIHLSVLQTLYEGSEIGHVAATMNKFNKLSSINKLVLSSHFSESDNSMTQTIMRMDRQMITWLRKRTRYPPAHYDSFVANFVSPFIMQYSEFCSVNKFKEDCSFSLRLFLTSHSYGFHPRLILGPFVPSPTEQIRFFQNMPNDMMDHSIKLIRSKDLPKLWYERETIQGPFPLYLGSATQDPVHTLKLTSLSMMEGGKAIKSLLRVLAWVSSSKSGEAVIDLIVSLINTRVKLDSHTLHALHTGTSGGTLSHRFSAHGDDMGCFTSSPTQISSWWHLSTNGSVVIQQGEQDRFIFFQACFQYIYCMLRLCGTPPIGVHALVRGDCCSYPIPEGSFEGDPIVPTEVIQFNTTAIVDPFVEKQIREEAISRLEVQALSSITSIHPSLVLSGIIALEQSNIIRQYRLTSSRGGEGFTGATGIYHNFNVTLMRKVTISALMTSMVLSFIFHRTISHAYSLIKFISAMVSHFGSTRTSVNAMMFQDLLRAIVIAGKLPILCWYAQYHIRWDHGGQHLALLPVLIHGLHKAAIDLSDGIGVGTLVLEYPTGKIDKDRIIKFMKRMCKPFNKWIRSYPYCLLDQALIEFNKLESRFSIVITTDSKMLIDHARKSPDMRVPQLNPDLNYRPCNVTPLRLLSNPLPPFFMINYTQLSVHDSIRNTVIEPWSCDTPLYKLCKLYQQIGRWGLISSGGKLKLVDILMNSGIPFQDSTLIVSIAEGAASYLSTLLHIAPNAVGVYNSLMDHDEISTVHIDKFFPPEILCSCEASTHVINLPFKTNSGGDLCLDETWDELASSMSDRDLSKSVLTMDLDHKEDIRLIVFQKLNKFLELYHFKHLIIKLFLTDWYSANAEYINNISSYYKFGYLTKPVSSSSASSEHFLVCSYRSPDKSVGLGFAHHKISLVMTQHNRALSNDKLWNQAIKYAFWNRSLSFCNQSSAATLCKYWKDLHPLVVYGLSMLHMISHALMEANYSFSGLPSDELMIIHSNTRGGKMTYSWCCTILALFRFYNRAMFGHQWSDTLVRTEEDWRDESKLFDNLIATLTTAGLNDPSLEGFARKVGEVASCPLVISVNDLGILSQVLIGIWGQIPSSWNLHQAMTLFPLDVLPLQVKTWDKKYSSMIQELPLVPNIMAMRELVQRGMAILHRSHLTLSGSPDWGGMFGLTISPLLEKGNGTNDDIMIVLTTGVTDLESLANHEPLILVISACGSTVYKGLYKIVDSKDLITATRSLTATLYLRMRV